MPHDHSHHDHHHAPAGFGTAFALGTAINVAFVIAEMGYGVAAHSVALIADALHNIGDILGLLLAWAASVSARRPPSPRRTYGLGRTTIMAALGNATILLIGVGAITLEAVRRFADPAQIATATVMWVALVGVAINGFTAYLFMRGPDGAHSADLNIRATIVHFAGDAAVSLGVVIAALLIAATGLSWLDPAASLLIAAVIAATSWRVLRDAAHLALDGVPSGIAPRDVETYLRGLPGVIEVHDLHIWGLSTTEIALTAHLVQAGEGGEEVIPRACRGLRERFRIGHATLQLETESLATTCRQRPTHVV